MGNSKNLPQHRLQKHVGSPPDPKDGCAPVRTTLYDSRPAWKSLVHEDPVGPDGSTTPQAWDKIDDGTGAEDRKNSD